ncbi:Signal transduction histidine kinase, sporulation regulator SpoOB [Moorella glycerini]|uniref:Sporulation initiation phosphotransferase B n=1 Tax=Neomoorella stamsii TaxID=1266720 RepID=A0A9X7J4Q1_9FIRM|nr:MULTISPECIES: Spo0B domain-containing protein [Moorella]PRR76394.1 Sporulation initiation phosphotransferase B [Moorella stamsii]CEP67037.1 Signal transduction histidine kinase, sporulation regulator SpoOB [Moorella glycerini]
MTWQAAEVISLLRWQRHDILNHLQVISGYLQLQKSDRALSYLQEVIVQIEQVGRLMRLKQPELALASLLKMEQAAARGITLTIAVHTAMENLAVDDKEALTLWEAAWDLALALAGEGNTLQVSLSEVEEGYYLSFKAAVPAAVPAGAVNYLAGLAGRRQIPFTWEPETGEMGLLLRSR